MNITFYTGSGVSQESGVPTFRDPNGLWRRLTLALCLQLTVEKETSRVHGVLGYYQRSIQTVRIQTQ